VRKNMSTRWYVKFPLDAYALGPSSSPPRRRTSLPGLCAPVGRCPPSAPWHAGLADQVEEDSMEHLRTWQSDGFRLELFYNGTGWGVCGCL